MKIGNSFSHYFFRTLSTKNGIEFDLPISPDNAAFVAASRLRSICNKDRRPAQKLILEALKRLKTTPSSPIEIPEQHEILIFIKSIWEHGNGIKIGDGFFWKMLNKFHDLYEANDDILLAIPIAENLKIMHLENRKQAQKVIVCYQNMELALEHADFLIENQRIFEAATWFDKVLQNFSNFHLTKPNSDAYYFNFWDYTFQANLYLKEFSKARRAIEHYERGILDLEKRTDIQETKSPHRLIAASQYFSLSKEKITAFLTRRLINYGEKKGLKLLSQTNLFNRLGLSDFVQQGCFHLLRGQFEENDLEVYIDSPY